MPHRFVRQDFFDIERFDSIDAKVPQHFISNRGELGRCIRERLVPALLVLIEDAQEPLTECFLFRIGHRFGGSPERQFEDLVHDTKCYSREER